MPGDLEQRLRRLSNASIRQRLDPYGAQMPWPAGDLDVRDPRFELPEWDPLRDTDWYRDQTPDTRSVIGLDRTVQFMLTGVAFESVLERGLLRRVAMLASDNPERQFLLHEIAEEARHSLMFNEFACLAKRSAPGLLSPQEPGPLLAESIVEDMAVSAPEIFFISALAGEEPIDWVQRRSLRTVLKPHPLVAAICELHIADEARHLAYARAMVRHGVRQWGTRERRRAEILLPDLVIGMVARMLSPPRQLAGVDVPDPGHLGVAYRRALADAKRGAADRLIVLCDELGLADPTSKRWSRLTDSG